MKEIYALAADARSISFEGDNFDIFAKVTSLGGETPLYKESDVIGLEIPTFWERVVGKGEEQIIGNDKEKESLKIDNDTYEKAAEELGVEVEVLMAIGKKESKESGFYSEGQATILFERHKMYEELKKKGYTEKQLNKLTEKYPNIVNPVYGGYGKYSEQYEKLKIAKTIDYDCAIKSCSWGKFQVMGTYYSWLGSSPQELEKAMNGSEIQQFDYFVKYLKNSLKQMIPALKNKDWEKIATLYNGSNWKKQNPTYAKDLEKYYNEFKNKKK